ncbi:MAG: hypothetical protein IJC92_03555 [Bacteroidaceae bacterium]|nr:hypothetical protein [Bacteroidaceae bacterium]MBQ8365937.1 hypothetical protein [Bacteroidaceae bacterium]
MKKVFSFLKENPLFVLLSLVAIALAVFTDEQAGLTLAMATVVAPGTTKPSNGIAGLPTQGLGDATTVSNLSELSPDLIEAEVDERIIGVASDESIIDTIKRRIRRQVRVTSFEVDHYLIDDKRSKAYTNETYTGIGATRAEIPFSTTGERKIFQEYFTAICKGVNGYDPTGQIEMPGVDLMLFFVGKNSTTEAPIAMAVNGPKVNATDDYCTVPTIPAGTEIILLSSAAYETQKFIAPSTIVPVPERMYLQKQLCNSIVSDYFAAQKKRIQFNKSQIAEAILRQFRLESCRTAWVGQPGKFKVQAMDAAMGYQWDYFSKGIRWQFKRQYDLASKITFADLINLSMVKFTGFNCTKKAIWLLGKQLLNDIQKIDLTLHKNINVMNSTTFGIECTRIHTVFGDIDLIHDPTLDALGYSNCGGLIDANGLVRYYMKNEDSKTENVDGEEAQRQVVMTIDCLCLKGYSHIWVNGSAAESDIPGTSRVVSAAVLPESPNTNDVVVLTADVKHNVNGENKLWFSSGTVVTYNGSTWVEYTGEIIAA